jgi:hypothetical protein
MDKIPDEILYVAVIVLVIYVSSKIRALLPFDPGDAYYHDFNDDATP